MPNDYLPLGEAYGGLSGEQIKFLESLKASGGNASEAARHCGISVASHYKWKRTDESYRTVLAHIADAQIDQIEASLFNLAIGGNVQAAALLLKSWGRHRGYGDKLDVTVEADTKRSFVVSYATIAPNDN